MPKKPDPVATPKLAPRLPPEGASAFALGIDPSDLRLVEAIGVAISDDVIVVTNRVTGEEVAFGQSAYPVLERLMEWTKIDDLADLAEASDTTPEQVAKALSDLVETVETLWRIGVLARRSRDLMGIDLASPGPGWDVFLRYLGETRTGKHAAYAAADAYNALLDEKALVTRQPSAFYERVGAPFTALSPPLANQDAADSPGFIETMLARRTARRFADDALSEAELSRLLYFGWGMTGHVDNVLGDVFLRKMAPSGGSLHPLEVYPVILNVDGIEPGCYHYSVRRHGLEQISDADPREWIADAAGDQDWVREAGVVFVCTAFLPRSAWKYQYPRVGRVLLAEIGYTGQNMLLAASWLNLGAFTTMALRDEIFEERFGLDPLREPVLSICGAGRLEADISDHTRPRSETASPTPGA